MTNEATPEPQFNDFSFFVVNDEIFLLSDTNSSGYFPSEVPEFNERTPYQLFTYTFSTAGTYDIGFAVLQNVDEDTDFASALLVDGVIINNDFGDAPAMYGAAGHAALSAQFGTNRDTEDASFFSLLADGDDTDGIADEDGLVGQSIFTAGKMGNVTLDVQNTNGTHFINAWIDWDRNGSFEIGEQVAKNVAVSADGNFVLPDFMVPDSALPGNAYVARFRISDEMGIGPTGIANSGEVEDHLLSVVIPDPDTVYVSPTFTQTVGTAVDGNLAVTGMQTAKVGIDAFATLAEALAAVADDGTVVINDATYTEALLLNRSLNLQMGAVTVDSLTVNKATTVAILGNATASSLTVLGAGQVNATFAAANHLDLIVGQDFQLGAAELSSTGALQLKIGTDGEINGLLSATDLSIFFGQANGGAKLTVAGIVQAKASAGDLVVTAGTGDDHLLFTPNAALIPPADGLFRFDGKAGVDLFEVQQQIGDTALVDLALGQLTADLREFFFTNTEQLTVDIPTKLLQVNLSDAAENLVIADDGVAVNKFPLATELNSGFKLKFFHPTTDLLVDLAGGNDTLQLAPVDTALLPANIRFDGGAGENTFEFTGIADSAALDLSAKVVRIDDLVAKVQQFNNFVAGATTKTLSITLTEATETVELADDANAADQFSVLRDTTSGLAIRFFHSTDLFQIDLAAGNDQFKAVGLDSKLIPAKIEVLGGAGDDLLNGTAAVDLLFGGAGDDTLDGAEADDLLNGGVGLDTYRFNLSQNLGVDQIVDADVSALEFVGTPPDNTGITLDLTISATQSVTSKFKLALGTTQVNKVVGTELGDTIVGTGGADTLIGMGGNDVLLGGAGADQLDGGAGADSLDGGDGNDVVLGGLDADLIFGGFGNDVLGGNEGNDSIEGGAGDDALDGGSEQDQLFGGLGFDTLLGAAGDDAISGGEDADMIDGGLGNDLMFGELGNDTLLGSAGNDSLGGGADDDVLDGGLDNDLIFGDAGSDAITGGDGNDSIGGGAGDDVLDGAVGADLLFGEAGNDTVMGAAGNDAISGGSGADVLDGGADNDILFGEAGNDSIFAGTGNDTVGAGADDDTVDGAAGSDLIFGEAGADQLTGGDDADAIGGGIGDDFLYGLAGNESLFGEAGDDVLDGGLDNDLLFGAAGDDSLVGDAGDDTISGGSEADILFGGLGNDVLEGEAGNDLLEGGDGNDSLAGGSENDSLNGNGGNDTLEGQDGDDQLLGGTGNDIAFGGTGRNRVSAGNDFVPGINYDLG